MQIVGTSLGVTAIVWALAAAIVGGTSANYDSEASYNCWTCLENCEVKITKYCNGSIGEKGYDVGTVNASIFTILGLLSAFSSLWMFCSIVLSKRLKDNTLAVLLACMSLADFAFGLQYLIFGITKLSTEEYPYEPDHAFCSAIGFTSHVSQIMAVIFYVGFSVTTGILLWDPFLFRKLKMDPRRRIQWILLWIGIAIVYSLTTGIWGLSNNSIGVAVDGSCWLIKDLQWSFHILVFVAIVYSIILLCCMAFHTVKEAHNMARKYAVFIMAYVLYNIFWTIFTLIFIQEGDHPQSHGWGYAILETVTVLLQVPQGLINAFVYYFTLKSGRKGVASSQTTRNLTQLPDTTRMSVGEEQMLKEERHKKIEGPTSNFTTTQFHSKQTLFSEVVTLTQESVANQTKYESAMTATCEEPQIDPDSHESDHQDTQT